MSVGIPRTVPDLDAVDAAERLSRLEANIRLVFRGSREAVRLSVVCLVARGHVLIEDVPGVGKTTLAHALARSLGLSFQRIQFTSDLLPSDILGVSIWNQHKEAFEFVPGPIFASVVFKGMLYEFSGVVSARYPAQIRANELYLEPGLLYVTRA